MKNYLIIGIIILATILMYNILNLYTGVYINLNWNNTAEYYFYTDENNIYNTKTGESFEIKGVEISSFYPRI